LHIGPIAGLVRVRHAEWRPAALFQTAADSEARARGREKQTRAGAREDITIARSRHSDDHAHMTRFFITLLTGAIAACGSTTIKEQRIVQAQTQDGEIAYYRLTISADAKLAKSHFRAGLYDADAVDALITGSSGSVSLSNETAGQQLEAERRKAVVALARKYTEDLLANGDGHREIAKRLLAVVRSVYSTPDGDVVYKPSQKYVVIFSAIASVVEEAIASFAEEKETQQLVVASVASGRRSEFLENAARKASLTRKLDRLGALAVEIENLGEYPVKGSEEDRKAYSAKLVDLVNDASAIAGER
jgi:hypothetical protein